jgi:uncharacterized protein YbjT (DUF2867 family)
VPWTVVGPAAFMENYLGGWYARLLRRGVLSFPMPADKPLHLIAVADIAAFAALVLERPDEFAGRRVDIAGDVRTGPELAADLSTALGRPIRFEAASLEVARSHSTDLAAMFEYFGTTGMDVDVPALRASYPEVGWHTLADWAATQDWSAAA